MKREARRHAVSPGEPGGDEPTEDSESGATSNPAPELLHSTAIKAFEAEQRTARQALLDRRSEAIRDRQKSLGWLLTVGFGPAAILAVLLAAFVEGSGDLAIGFALLGAAVLTLRAWRAHKKVKKIERELEDPMDGS